MTRCASRDSFTLVELLLVIAIISILASLLMTALAKAREMARIVQCVNNQRQIALAMRLYTNDNDDRLPPYGNISGDPTRFWTSLIAPYLQRAAVANQGVGYTYMRCPSAPAFALTTYGVNYNQVFNFEGGSYSGSMALSRVQPSAMLTCDLGNAAAAGGAVAIYSPVIWPFDRDTDGDGLLDSYSAVIPFVGPYNGFGGQRHQNGGVCSFADGSVRKISVRDFVINNANLWGP